MVWAVDPFATDSQLQRSAALAIQAFTRNLPAHVVPVYLFMGNLAPLEVGLGIPKDFELNLRKDAQKRFSAIVKRIKIPHLKPLHVISDPFLTHREGADLLTNYSKKIGAEIIFASTHAKRGVRRLFTGSFVETLTLRSDIPLIVVNPSWNRTADLKNIIFPTDFSDESREAYDRILEIAKTSGSKITIFHKLSFYPSPVFDLAFSAYPQYQHIIKEETEVRKENAALWVKEAVSRGISAAYVLDEKLTGSAATAILEFAKKNPGMIALASHSGPLEIIFLGSTTRQILRNSTHPVWVIHPAMRREIKPLYSITQKELNEDLIEHRRKRSA